MKFKIQEIWETYNQARLGNGGELQLVKNFRLYRYEPSPYRDSNNEGGMSWNNHGTFRTFEEAKDHAELLKKRGAPIVTEFDL